MSKFAYKAEGELNSQYIYDLLKEYLSKISESNYTKDIVENDYKIDPNTNRFKQWCKDFSKRLFNSAESLKNYNKVLTNNYVKAIVDKIDIFMQTNVLTSKQIFDLKQTFQSIHFDRVLPLIDENRESAIKASQKRFLRVLNDIKYLKHANVEYVLYNSPVNELKPFLTDKVSSHKVNFIEIQKLVKQLVAFKYNELNNFNFEPYEVKFLAKCQDFYNDNITDSGVGEEVEEFIRLQMIEKLEIASHEEVLPDELNVQIEKINTILKRLKVHKIEKMMQDLIKLKTNLAHAKEVIDDCKDIINSSTITNKAQIFLVMDNLYYKLSKKCETLQQKIKLKLQLVDKQKLFAMYETIKYQLQPDDNYNEIEEEINTLPRPNKSALHTKKMQTNAILKDKQALDDRNELNNIPKKADITSNLYDDDEDGEIHITEDDGEADAEEEIVIDEDK